jgi:hypothetical protein
VGCRVLGEELRVVSVSPHGGAINSEWVAAKHGGTKPGAACAVPLYLICRGLSANGWAAMDRCWVRTDCVASERSAKRSRGEYLLCLLDCSHSLPHQTVELVQFRCNAEHASAEDADRILLNE